MSNVKSKLNKMAILNTKLCHVYFDVWHGQTYGNLYKFLGTTMELILTTFILINFILIIGSILQMVTGVTAGIIIVPFIKKSSRKPRSLRRGWIEENLIFNKVVFCYTYE